MKLIKSYFEIINQQPNEIGMLKHIETCGRVAWKSEERTTNESYLKFIEMLKGVNHGSVLEHGTVYLTIPNNIEELKRTDFRTYQDIQFLSKNPYSKVVNWEYYFYITTNYRVIVENNLQSILKYQSEYSPHEKRVTVRLVIDRGVSHEFVRHRTFSFTQESTRYCNYSKDKFGNEITFITPLWLNDIKEITTWELTMKYCENSYNLLLSLGWKPQQARSVLPNSLKTELIMTGFISDWQHFFHLRTAQGAHPQAQEIAIPLKQEFKKLGYL